MKKTYYKNKKYFLSGLFIAIAVFAVVSPKIVNANVIISTLANSAVALMSAPILLSLGTISVLCVAVCGLVNSLIISALINISKYNNFIHEPSIVGAWVVVRDLCNMFFILILLFVAFATILRLPNYEWKKLLPKLLIMAVLINFSRTICGLIIDGSQIIMLTFVNAWANAGEFVDIMGMAKYFHGTMFDKFTEPDWSVLKVVTGMIVGIMFLIISIIVLLVTVSVFLIRVVMLWIYIVLSPIAFLAAAFPAGQKYATQWWTEFMRYIINGPVLAFFIWMALISKNQITKIGDINTANATANQCFGITEATCLNNFLPWIISIGMLLGGLMITQQIGGIAGSIAGKGMDWAKKAASKVLSGDNFAARKVARFIGVDLRPIKLAESFMASRETGKRKDESEIRKQGREHFESEGVWGGFRSVAFGMGAGEDYFNRYVDGMLGQAGIWRAVKEMSFFNPLKRRGFGEDIDGVEGNIKTKQAERETELAAVQPLIERQYDTDKAGDNELARLKNKQAANNRKVAHLRKKKKHDLTGDEEEKIKDVDNKNNELKAMEVKRDQEIRQESRKKILESDKGKNLGIIEGDLDKLKDSLKKLKDQIMKVQAPVAFEARSAYRKDVEEAKAKYKSITNAQELMKAYVDAAQRNDKFDQAALLEKISSDGNLNEILKENSYKSDGRGLYSYIYNLKNDFGEEKGLKNNFSKGERIQILNDLSELEERVGHWEMAKMVGMNNKGEMESLVQFNKNGTYDDSKHAMAAFAEIMKMDPQRIVNSLNRLAMGGEDGSGKFQISNLGMMIYKALAEGGVWKAQENRILTNTASNLADERIIPILEKLVSDSKKSKESLTAIKNRGSMEGDTANPIATYEAVKRAGVLKTEI